MIARLYTDRGEFDQIENLMKELTENGYEIYHSTKRSITFTKPGEEDEVLEGEALGEFITDVETLTDALQEKYPDDTIYGYVPEAPELLS